jgi:hypothetical protein
MSDDESDDGGAETLREAVDRRGEGPGLPTDGYVPDPAEVDRWTDLDDEEVTRYYQFRQAREAQRHRIQQETEFDLAIVLLLAAAVYWVAEEFGVF